MGGSCRRASQRPVAGAHYVYDGTQYRRSPAEPAVSARHRVGVVLQALPQCQRQGFAHCIAHFVCAGGSRALWRRTWHHHRGRLVRAVLCQYSRHVVQYGPLRLYSSVGCCRHLGHLGNPECHRGQLEAPEYCVHALCRYAWCALLRLWLVGLHHRHRHPCCAVVCAEPSGAAER